MAEYSLLPRQQLRMLPISLFYNDVAKVTGAISCVIFQILSHCFGEKSEVKPKKISFSRDTVAP